MEDVISTQYNSIAEHFSTEAEKYGYLSRKAFNSVLNIDFQNKRLLDVGCGDGYDLEEYQRRGSVVHGLDASEEFLRRIEERFTNSSKEVSVQKFLTENLRKFTTSLEVEEKNVNLSVGFMEEMPYPDNFFDIVLSKYALQVSTDVPKVISEITRVLKPGGILAYLTVHPFRHFMEKKKAGKDYFLQETVESRLFDRKVIVYEPSHTLNEYLSPYFFANYKLMQFEESPDYPSAERINNDNYPGFLIIKAQKNLYEQRAESRE